MFEASLIALLAADTALAAKLSTFGATPAPAIFSGMAPQKATRPYIVFDIDKLSVENMAASAFAIVLDIYIREESGVDMLIIAERIEFICDMVIIRDDPRFGQIRLVYEDGREVENSDIKIRHYVVRLSARAGRKKWAAET